MSLIPPDPLPPDHNVGPVLIAWTSVLTTFSIITTVLRIIVRRGTRYLGWDDWTILATVVVATVRSCLNIKGATVGYGRHKWYLSLVQQQRVNMYGWYGQVLLFFILFLLKTSICILILRIKNSRSLRWTIYPLVTGLVLTNAVCIIILLAECEPVATFWRPSAGKCWEPKYRIYSIYLQASYSVFSDFICSLLPIFLLKDLSIPLKTKVAVCGLMAMGLVATTCSAVRASTLGTKPNDITYDYAVTAIWSNTEIHLGIIATNLSLCRAMWAYFFSTSIPTSSSDHGYSYDSSTRRHRPTSWFLRTIDLLCTTNTTAERDSRIHPSRTHSTRRVSRRNSKASDVPLDPVVEGRLRQSSSTGITKTTDIMVTEESERGSGEARREERLGNYRSAWNVTPAVG